MTKTTKIILGIIGVAVLVVGYILGSLGAYQSSNKPVNNLGAVSYDVNNFAGGISVGMRGTTITKIITGTCNLVAVGSNTIAAGGTKTATCAASGVVSGDKVMVRLPYVSGSNVVTTGASASTTASGYITVGLLNASSTLASAVTDIGTSTQYFVTR